MVLAAGKGTRLYPITARLPKPLVDIGETCPLIRTLELLAAQGVKEVAINTHRFADTVRDAVYSRAPKTITYHFLHEPELLETGGGIKQALSVLGKEPFWVINGDVVWDEGSAPLLHNMAATFTPALMDALLMLIPYAKTRHFRTTPGDFALDEGGLLSRPADTALRQWVYGCVQIMQPRLVSGVTEQRFTLLPCFEKAALAGRLYGLPYYGEWVDIGNHEGLETARRLVAAHLKKAC